MPASKHKPITSSPEGSTPQSSTPIAPDQEEFRKSLRRLAVSAVQVLIEQVMREELEQCIGASWGECTPERRGYRNGTYTRESVTSTGRIEDIHVPRDREGQFHTQAFERYSRYEPHIAQGLTEMFVAGTSTRHPWEKWPKRCWESLEVGSTISRLNQTLTQQFEAWRERPRPRALAYPVPGRHSFQHSSWRQD